MRVEHKDGSREVYFDSFPPGSVIALKISLFPHVKEAVDSVRYAVRSSFSMSPKHHALMDLSLSFVQWYPKYESKINLANGDLIRRVISFHPFIET